MAGMDAHSETLAAPPRPVPDPPPSAAAAPDLHDRWAQTAPQAAIALLQQRSLPELLQREIERMIVEGELLPGDKLTEATLAARLGVSRGPLREAFRMLDEAGLLRSEKNRGVFVRDIDLDEAADIFDLRALLERHAAERLAERRDAAALAALEQGLAELDAAARAGDRLAYHRANLRFHDRLVELAGNRKLLEQYRRLIKELALLRRQGVQEQTALERSCAEHRAIVAAVAAADAAQAARLVEAHVLHSKARLLQAAASAA